MNGSVVRLFLDKGYGFLQDAVSHTDYFFHRSGVVGGGFEALRVGDLVTYDLDPAATKGPRARTVQKVRREGNR